MTADDVHKQNERLQARASRHRQALEANVTYDQWWWWNPKIDETPDGLIDRREADWWWDGIADWLDENHPTREALRIPTGLRHRIRPGVTHEA